MKWLKCGFQSTWAPPGRHFSASAGSFALARPLLGFPGPPLTPLWVSPGALWVRSRCFFGVFRSRLDVGPVSVLFGVGRDVRSVHACACLVRVRLVSDLCRICVGFVSICVGLAPICVGFVSDVYRFVSDLCRFVSDLSDLC